MLLLGYVACAQVLRAGVGVRRVVICEYVYDEALVLSVRAQHTLNTLESVSILQRKYMYLLREYTCISFSAVYTQHCCVHTAHTHVHIYIACSSLRIHHTAPLLQDGGQRAIVTA